MLPCLGMNGLDGDNAMSDMNDGNASSLIVKEISGQVGCLTLNRPKALNALSLDMVRDLTSALTEFQNNPQVLAVLIRGHGKESPFGHFCAGGDIRFFHAAALAGDSRLADFFTEEYLFGCEFGDSREQIANKARLHLSKKGESKVFILGDTPHDIMAARLSQFPVISVATGDFSFEELSNHNPDLLLRDLS